MEQADLGPQRPPPPELTGGQRLAGMFLRFFGNFAMAIGGAAWVMVILATILSFNSGHVLVYGVISIGLAGALLFLIVGRVAHQFGQLLSGTGPRLSGRLIVKKLLYDMTFELTGLLFVPFLLIGLAMMFYYKEYSMGGGVVALALLTGFGLPRLIGVFLKKM